jgi:hypothetical protein
VRPLGFEPRTCGLRVRCSAVELEAHRSAEAGPQQCRGRKAVPHLPLGVIDGTRTRDNQYHKLGLYQLSYDHQEGNILPGRRADSTTLCCRVDRRLHTLGGGGVSLAGTVDEANQLSGRPFTTDSIVC